MKQEKSSVKGKLAHTSENMQRILELAQNKDYCYGINEYDFICYVRFESDNSQLWALVNRMTHKIRNCGLNITDQEHRVWRQYTGITPRLNNNMHQFQYSLTMFQTFNSMRMYMTQYFHETSDEDVGLLLSGLMLSNDREDWQKNPRTWDPVAWDDWMEGVIKTLSDMNISDHPKEILYDEQMAFLCMKNYLQIFYLQIKFEGIKNILKNINAVKINSDTFEWSSWLNCIQAVLDQEHNIVA